MLVGTQRVYSLREGDLFSGAIGASLPIGRTEEDPWTAGDRGEKHTHPQLGNGTFDPLLELRYGVPVGYEVSALGGVHVRFPVYENSKTYRGPIELRADANVLTRLGSRWTAAIGYDLLFQGYSQWNGTRDPNSGIVSQSVRLGAGTALAGTGLQLSAFFPFHQNLLQDEGDGFEQGPTFLLSIARAF